MEGKQPLLMAGLAGAAVGAGLAALLWRGGNGAPQAPPTAPNALASQRTSTFAFQHRDSDATPPVPDAECDKSLVAFDQYSPSASRHASTLHPMDDSGRGTPTMEKTLTEIDCISRSYPPRYPIFRVAITGGPCSGKSTCMEKLRINLTNEGFFVFVVPETATLLINGGLEFSNMTAEKRIGQQCVILQTVMSLENSFYEIAKTCNRPCVILCDRGTMDGRAYCDNDEWDIVLKRTGYTLEELRDARYDAVVHLVTAARGAEKHYTTENNSARRETAEEARQLDETTKRKWIGHNCLHVIDNSTSFNKKVARVIDVILNLVGVKTSQRTQRRFLANPPTTPIPDETNEALITVRTLHPAPGNVRENLVTRSNATTTLYFHQVSDKTGFRSDSRVSAKTFAALLTRENKSMRKVVKTNISFFHDEKYYQIKVFQEPKEWENIAILCAPNDVEAEQLPKFVEVLREVTNDDDYKTVNIAAEGEAMGQSAWGGASSMSPAAKSPSLNSSSSPSSHVTPLKTQALHHHKLTSPKAQAKTHQTAKPAPADGDHHSKAHHVEDESPSSSVNKPEKDLAGSTASSTGARKKRSNRGRRSGGSKEGRASDAAPRE